LLEAPIFKVLGGVLCIAGLAMFMFGVVRYRETTKRIFHMLERDARKKRKKADRAAAAREAHATGLETV